MSTLDAIMGAAEQGTLYGIGVGPGGPGQSMAAEIERDPVGAERQAIAVVARAVEIGCQGRIGCQRVAA